MSAQEHLQQIQRTQLSSSPLVNSGTLNFYPTSSQSDIPTQSSTSRSNINNNTNSKLNSETSPNSNNNKLQNVSNNQMPYLMMIHPQTYSINNRLNNILIKSDQMIACGQIDEFIRILSVLKQKINFLNKNDKKYDHIIQIICHYNLGCGYQNLAFVKGNQNAMDQCFSNLQVAIDNIKKIVLKDDYKKYEIKLKFIQAKMQLQYCALLSQIQSHQEALKGAVQILGLLIGVISNSYDECLKRLELLSQKNSKISKSQQNISFAKNLLTQSVMHLKQLTELQNYQSIMFSSCQKFVKIKQNNYFWRDNFQNNQKALRKSLQHNLNQQIESQSSYFPKQTTNTVSSTKNNTLNSTKTDLKASVRSAKSLIINQNSSEQATSRNLLGLKVVNTWTQQLTIGKMMHMIPLKYEDYIQPDNIVYEFTFRHVIQKAVLISIVYFSIATEMRFIEQKKQKLEEKSKKNTGEQIKKSQIFHLKAIELACKYIKQSCPFVQHLISSYLRHYHNNLNTIAQQPSFAQQSLASNIIPKDSTQINVSFANISQNRRIQYQYMGSMSKNVKAKDINEKINNMKGKNPVSLIDSQQFKKQLQQLKQSKQKQRALQRMTVQGKKNEHSLSSSHVKSLQLDRMSMASSKARESITVKTLKCIGSTIKTSYSKSKSKSKSKIKFMKKAKKVLHV